MYPGQSIKIMFITSAGFVLSAIIHSLGGYDEFLRTLLAFMTIDIITGWLAAAFFKNSTKTETGRLASAASFRGLLKKGCMLLMIVIAVMLDELMKTNGLTRDAVIIAFVLNELLSILENMGLMGIKLPTALTNALELLSKRTDTTHIN